VHQRQRRAVPRVGQVRVEGPELRRGQHAPCRRWVRADRLAKYTPASCSARLRRAERHPLEFHAATGPGRPRRTAGARRAARARALSPAGGDVETGPRASRGWSALRPAASRARAGVTRLPFGWRRRPCRPRSRRPRAAQSSHVARKNSSGIWVKIPRPVPGFPGRRPWPPGARGCTAPAGLWPLHHDRRVQTGPRRKPTPARVVLEPRVVKASGDHVLSCRLLHNATSMRSGTTLAQLGRHCYTDITSPGEIPLPPLASLVRERAAGARGLVRYMPSTARMKNERRSPSAP